MPEEQFQERTEKATPRRRQKAREEGKVARSTDLNSAVILCLGIATIYFMGPTLADQLHQFMSFIFTEAPNIVINNNTIASFFSDRILGFFYIMAPLLVILVAIAYGINVLQVGILFSSKSLEPKLDKLNIVTGAKRLISIRSLVELVRDCTKVIIVATVGYLSISSQMDSFMDLSDNTVAVFAATLGTMSLKTSLHIGMVMLVLALLDYAYQKYDFEKSIRMSKQEIREENKETEGSPQTRARIRRIQREMSQKRMMREIPKADVVVTNPTHIAIALKYDQDEMQAPMVVAKGERLLAEKIKEIAKEADVPIVENKPLARALFGMCEIGSFVPDNLYRAVAEVLAYVYRLRKEKV
jgi:flagellar biosynthetic protein FlhB